MPFFVFFFFFFNLANLGFPPTLNFISELLIFIGLFSSLPSISLLTLSGIFLSAIYSFVLLTRIAFGPSSIFITKFFDLTRREFLILLPLALFTLFLGLFPSVLTCYLIVPLKTWFC